MSDFLPSDLPVITPGNADLVVPLIELPHRWGVSSVAFHPVQPLLATGHEVLRLWNLDAGTQDALLQAGDGVIQDVAFQPGGALLAAATADHSVRLWAVAASVQVGILRSERTVLRSVAFRPDGRLVAAGSGDFADEDTVDNAVYVWDARANWNLTVLNEPAEQVCVAFSPDGQWLAAGESNGDVLLWDAETLDFVERLAVPAGDDLPLDTLHHGVAEVIFSPQGDLLAAGGHSSQSPCGGAICLWDMAERAIRDVWCDDSEDTNSIAFNPAGSLIASGGSDAGANAPSAVRLWDVATGDLLAVLEHHPKPVASVAFSPDGRLLVSGAGDSVVIWGVKV